jgi:phage shock protein PspC (stress-responsive transcriptional regulator)
MNENSGSELGPGEEHTAPQPEATQAPAGPGAPAGPPPPPPPSPGATYTRRLVRRTDDKVIAGVASGLAAYTGTDPALWRVGFVLAAIFGGGLGLLAYIVLWLATPEARPGELPEPVESDVSWNGPKWVAVAAIVLGVLIALRGVFDIFDFLHGGVIVGIVLIGVGIAIWGRDWSSGSRPPAPRPPVPPQPSRASWAAPAAEAARPAEAAPAEGSDSASDTDVSASATTWPGATSASAATWPMPTTPVGPVPPPRGPSGPHVPPAPKPRREPSLLGRFVVGAAALAVGGALILDETGLAEVTAKTTIAVLLGIVGVGLLVGTWRGHARWLIFPGAALALALITVTAIPFNLEGGWGEIAWSPQTAEEIAPSYEHGAGQAALDLSAVEFGRNDDIDVDVRLGFGELYIVLPEDPDVEVRARVQGGEIDLFGRVADGWDIRQSATDNGEARRAPTVTIDTRVTFGELHVLRGTSSDVPGLINDRFGPDRDRRFDFRNN